MVGPDRGAKSRLIILNASEIPVEGSVDVGLELRFQHMNRVLEEVVTELPNASILDVRDFITSRDDMTDYILHYRRRVYLQIADRLREMVGGNVAVKRVSLNSLRLVLTDFKRRMPPSVLHVLGEIKKFFLRK